MTKQEIIRLYIDDLAAHVQQSPARDNRIFQMKEELERSDNSDYTVPASPAPKLPSFEDISKSLSLHEPTNGFYLDGVYDCYNTVIKLGNFG